MIKTINIKNKKGVSPLIATILLVVVSVILVVVVLTWGKDFVSDSLVTTTDILDTYKEADLGFYLKIFRSGNGRIIVDYFPPSNSPLQDLNLVGYGLLGYTEHVVPFEPPILLEANKRGQIIDHGIMLDRFDLLLYTEDGYVITKKNISQEILQPSNCPEGYIPVPGNYLYGTAYPGQNGFCVMKYDAKVDENGDGIGDVNETCRIIGAWDARPNECPIDNINQKLVSTPQGDPVWGFSLEVAKTSCEAVADRLINNDEYMTIARNIELVPYNWIGGVVGQNGLYKGHSDGHPYYALEATFDDNNGYYGKMGEIGDYNVSQRRTFKLSNNQIIWDFSGNMLIAVDFHSFTIKDTPDVLNLNTNEIFFGYTTIFYNGVFDDEGVLKQIHDLKDFKYKDLMLLNKEIMNYEYNVGKLSTWSGYSDNDDGILRMMRRSGAFDNTGGIASLGLNQPATSTMSGARCIIIPK